MADGIAANRGMRVLSLASNSLRPLGSRQLARGLVTNATAKKGAGLTALDLSFTSFTDGPVSILARGLKAGSSLRRLDLSHNQLGTASAAGLAAMLSVHQGMQMLVLDHNPAIAFEGCKALLALQIDRVVDDVLFSPAPKWGTSAAKAAAGNVARRCVHVAHCSAKQLPAGLFSGASQWERQLMKVGLCGYGRPVGFRLMEMENEKEENRERAAAGSEDESGGGAGGGAGGGGGGSGAEEEKSVQVLAREKEEALKRALEQEEAEAEAAEAEAQKEAEEAVLAEQKVGDEDAW